MKNDIDNVWIALAHVKPRPGFENILNGNVGAYVNIIVKAHDIEELKNLANKVFFEEGFIFTDELINAALLSERLKNFDVDQDILDLVYDLNEIYPVQFGIFDSYPKEDS